MGRISWGRALREQGHEVRLMPTQYVKPYVKTNKSDYIDAKANLIRSQKLEYVLLDKADLTAIVIPNQPDRPFLPVPHGNAALSIDVRLPQANTLERLLAQGAELAGHGNGQPDRNFCLVAHTLTCRNLCVQVVQHPVDDNASARDVGAQRECPTSDFLVTLEPSAPGPV